MARNDNVEIEAETWTQLTNANATAVRVSNITGPRLLLKATAGETAPTDQAGAVPLDAGLTVLSDVTLATMFPGVSGANRLWAYSRQAGSVSVSHADA